MGCEPRMLAPEVFIVPMTPQAMDRRFWEEHGFNPIAVQGTTRVPGADRAALGWLSLLAAATQRPAIRGDWYLLAEGSAVPNLKLISLTSSSTARPWSAAVGDG